MPAPRALLSSSLALLAVGLLAPAAHADPVRNIEINNKPPSQTPGADIAVEMFGNRIGVLNHSTDASNLFVVGYQVQLGPGAQLADTPQAKFSGCQVMTLNGFQCKANGAGTPPMFNDSVTLAFTPSSQNYSDGIYAINVVVQDGCAAGRRRGAARVAAAQCADDQVPGTPKISETTIQGKSASFKYKASGATKYSCTLAGPGSKKKTASCGASKSYKGLAKGSYKFLVTGVNKKGKSKKAATKAFRIA
jgi:hypothetical protein